MNQNDFFQKLNTPPFLIAGMVLAAICGAFGWIGAEFVVICLLAGVVGLVVHYRKNRKP
jgi:cell division protein FtsX